MPTKESKILQARLIEFTCSKCGCVVRASDDHDEYRRESDTLIALTCNHLMWPHACYRCGEPALIAGSYPRLSVENGANQAAVWILEKAVDSKLQALRCQLRRLSNNLK